MMMTTTTTVVILIVSLSPSIESETEKVIMYYYGDGYKCAMITKI